MRLRGIAGVLRNEAHFYGALIVRVEGVLRLAFVAAAVNLKFREKRTHFQSNEDPVEAPC